MSRPDPGLADVLTRVAAHEPRARAPSPSGFRAATALVLAGGDEAAFLVIRRATRAGDPWSGHVALPGGRQDESDASLEATARRETLEEVGVRLERPAVGRLDDQGGRGHLGVVATYVFGLEHPVPTVPEPGEVAEARWLPLDVLVDPSTRSRHPHPRLGPWPAWRHEGLVIWGLTHRILRHFTDVAGLGTS